MVLVVAAARLLTVVAALCSLAASESLVMEGSNFKVELEDRNKEELGPKSLLKKLSLIALQCTMSYKGSPMKLEEPSITWTKEGSNATLDSRYDTLTVASLDGRNFTSMLRLRRPMDEDITNYTCNGTAKDLGWALGTARMLSKPLIVTKVGNSKTFDISVWPGDSLTITCQSEGNPTGTVEWYRKATDGSLTSLGNVSMLNFTELSYEKDRGYLVCRSVNEFGVNSAQIFLRVKNDKAYVPPLIIIIIEAIILAAVIAAYEVYMKRKRSQMASEQGAAYKVD